MDFSSVKLIAADMDGTLLNSNHELSADFFPVFHAMKAKGLWFSAASGRQYYNLVNKFDAIKDEVIFIAENGSYVAYNGEELLVQAMHPEVTMQQLKVALEIPDVYPILCGKKQAYVQHTNEQFIKNVEMYYDKYVIVDDLNHVTDDEFLKIALCDLAGSEGNSYNYFKGEQGNLQVKVSGSIWLDLSHILANKGRAIEVLQKKYGIGFNETMVFGDYLNDVEMMRSAKYSYAMENAHPDVKQAAKFIAKSNDDNGVINVLQEMLKSNN
ncbi:MAG: Cof-type HAD-IIB family hydrolase [Ferruginibacter sp.]